MDCSSGQIWTGDAIVCSIELRDAVGLAMGASLSDFSFNSSGPGGLTSWYPSSLPQPQFEQIDLSTFKLTLPTQALGDVHLTINIKEHVFEAGSITVINACSPNPCKNGASCSTGPRPHFLCACSPGYTGKTCNQCLTPIVQSVTPSVARAGGGTVVQVIITNMTEANSYALRVGGFGTITAFESTTTVFVGRTETMLRYRTRHVPSAGGLNVVLDTSCGAVTFPFRYLEEPPASVMSVNPPSASSILLLDPLAAFASAIARIEC